MMMKWLRKHTKQIMVVVVLLAMLSFVGGSALQYIASPQRGGEAFATAFGEEITFNDQRTAQRAASVLDRLGLLWIYDPMREMTIDHWYLLAEEAERAGIQVSDEEVDDLLETLLQEFQRRGFPADYIGTLRSRFGITIVDVHRALRRHMAIQKCFARVKDAAAPSASEIRHYVRDTEDKVRVRLVVLDALKFVDPTEPLSEEAVLAQFESGKDVTAAESELGHGYKHPRRVRLQYVHANAREMEPQMSVSLEETKAHWKKNKAKYMKTVMVDDPQATTAPATTQATSGPAAQPVEPKKISTRVQKTFSEARADVEREIRRKKARQLADRAMGELARELLEPWMNQKTDPETGYKPIPPGVAEPEHMRSICDRVSREVGVTLEYGEVPLSTADELTRVQALQATMIENEAGDRIGISDYAFRVPPFIKTAVGRDAGLCLQLYQAPDVPLTDSTTLIYGNQRFEQPKTRWTLFRVVEAREEEVPASVDAVRSRVEEDLRQMWAFERAGPAAKELYAVASRVGLEAAVERFEELRTRYEVGGATTPPPFAKRVSLSASGGGRDYQEAIWAGETTLTAPYVGGVGASEEFADACFEMTTTDWQPQVGELPVTPHVQWASTQPAATPTPVVRLLSVPKLKKWFVIELLGTDDVDEEKFDRELRMVGYGRLKWERQQRLRMLWFKPENIEARCGFQRIEQPADADAGEDTVPAERPAPLRL